jgi:hypothetical protein
MSSIQNDLKQGDALSHFNFALEYAIRKFHGYQVGMKLDWTHQFPILTDDMHLLENNINTIKKNTEALIDASEEVGLEIKTKQIIC